MIIIPRWRGRVYNQGKLSKGVDMSWWGPDFPSAEMIERGGHTMHPATASCLSVMM